VRGGWEKRDRKENKNIGDDLILDSDKHPASPAQ